MSARPSTGSTGNDVVGREVHVTCCTLVARLHESEVQHLHEVVLAPLATGKDVARFNVAMNHTRFVCFVQRVADLAQEIHGSAWRHRPKPLDKLSDAKPLEQFHDVVEGTLFGDAEIIEVNGVVGPQGCRCARLAHEASGRSPLAVPVGAQRLRSDHLHSCWPVQHPVLCHPDLTHPPGSEWFFEGVTANLAACLKSAAVFLLRHCH
jgi:hypothetical protein